MEEGGSFESLSTIQPSVRRLDPFWATRLWQKLINEVRTRVRVCRQRYFLKNYDDVFNGDDLVDVVLEFLKQCTSELDVNRISRHNVIKVCQVLMEKHLFESAIKESSKFEDGSTRFYRFIKDENCQEVQSKDDHHQKENIKPLQVPEVKSSYFSPYRTTSTVFTPNFSRCSKRRSLRLKANFLRFKDANTKSNLVQFSKQIVRDEDQEVRHSLRDTALTLLLQIIDLPILESILSIDYDLPEITETPQPYVLENDFTPRKIQPTKLDNFSGPVVNLPWVRAASACLGGRHPAGIRGLWSVQACKILCYKSVYEKFTCSIESLIPGEYFAVCVAIVKMLKEERRQRALYALQLLMLHLPWRRRMQLRNLLNFLHLVVEDIFVSVDKRVTNYEAVLNDFLNVVFKHPLVSDEPRKILFNYLILKSQVVFNSPSNLQKVKEFGIKYCKPILENHEDISKSKTTQQSVLNLATFVMDSTHIKLSEKKSWLKRLKKHHPEAFEACNFTE